MESMIQRNLDYIKLQWEDIRHCRQQEWTALAAIAGVFYAMSNVNIPYPECLEIKIFLGMVGILCSLIGACISWRHGIIFQEKIKVIRNLEHQIGIQYPMGKKALFPVQVLLFLIFGGLTSAFATITSRYIIQASYTIGFEFMAYVIGAIVFGTFFTFSLFRRTKALESFIRSIQALTPNFVISLMDRNQTSEPNLYMYNHPFIAEMEDLETCLSKLGDVPLKLIVEGTLDRTLDIVGSPNKMEIKENIWADLKWKTTLNGGLMMTKPVLLNLRDVFQFSIANQFSKQEQHGHSRTFELFVSAAKMEVTYEPPDKTGPVTIPIEKGVLIVPPGIKRRVTLHGTTFVFNAMLYGTGIGNDKMEGA